MNILKTQLEILQYAIQGILRKGSDLFDNLNVSFKSHGNLDNLPVLLIGGDGEYTAEGLTTAQGDQTETYRQFKFETELYFYCWDDSFLGPEAFNILATSHGSEFLTDLIREKRQLINIGTAENPKRPPRPGIRAFGEQIKSIIKDERDNRLLFQTVMPIIIGFALDRSFGAVPQLCYPQDVGRLPEIKITKQP